MPGALWAIPDPAGWYPALLSQPIGPVHGMLYAAATDFGPELLARLDEWEDYRPGQPADSLYLRQEMPVTDAMGICVAAQVYRFNQPLPTGARPIPGGDFQGWLAATGFTAFAG